VDVNTVLTAASTALLLVLAVLVVVFGLAVRKVWGEALAFVSPAGENQPSALALLISQVAHQSGQAMAMEVKTTLMGKESSLRRGERAVAGDVALDLLSQEKPLLAGVLEGFPTLKKRLLKNPALLDAALGLLGGMNKGSGSPPGGDGGSKQDAVFSL